MAERMRFSVLPGGAARGEPSYASAGLVAVAPAHAPDQISLGPWANAPSGRCVLSVGFQGIDFARFCQLLTTYNIRHVVDIRALPAFRSRGFQAQTLVRLFDEMNIDYKQIRLANVFESSTHNPHLARAHYEQFLSECGDVLEGLARLTESAPIMLLGSGVSHFGEERELLVRHLGTFTSLHVIAHEGSAPHWIISPYTLDGPKLKAPVTKSTKNLRCEQQNSQQLALAWQWPPSQSSDRH